MFEKFILLICLFNIIQTELYIEQPENIKSHIQYSVSTFGDVYYEQETELKLLLPSKDNINGCKEFTPLTTNNKERIVYLVKRGVCTYSKKAYLAQQSGAFTVIVYHDKPHVDVENIIPVQDSTQKMDRYYKINCKTQVIYIQDQTWIQQFKKPGQQKDVIDVEFWMNPTSIQSYKFITLFYPSLDNFADKFQDLSNTYEKNFLQKHCYARGKYCQMNSNFDSQQVLLEGVRQICIFQQSQKTNKDKDVWWQYIQYYKQCLQKLNRTKKTKNLDCFERFIKDNYAPKDKIEQCVDTSFSQSNNKYMSDNYRLDENKNTFEYESVYLIPALFIDGNLVKENLKNDMAISAICNKLIDKPLVCDKYHQIITWNHESKISTKHFIFWTIIEVFTAMFLIILFIHCMKQRTSQGVKNEIKQAIDNHISEYMKISGEKKA